VAAVETSAIRLADSTHASRLVGHDFLSYGVLLLQRMPLSGAMRRGLQCSLSVS
jgi:hypothetical protein